MSNKKQGRDNKASTDELNLTHLLPTPNGNDVRDEVNAIFHKMSCSEHETNKFDAECCKKVADKLTHLYASRGIISGDLTEHHKQIVDFSPEVEMQRYLEGQAEDELLCSAQCQSSNHQPNASPPEYPIDTLNDRILAIVAEGKYLESRMKELGAKGGGISTMKRSIKYKLPDWVLKHCDVISEIHFKALHRLDYNVSRQETESFLEACSQLRAGFFCVDDNRDEQ